MTAVLWGMIYGFITSALVPLVKRILVALGFSSVLYAAVDGIIAGIKGYVFAELAGAPAQVLSIIGLLRLDEAVNLVLSAIVFRLLFTGIMGAGGQVKRTTWNPPTTGA